MFRVNNKNRTMSLETLNRRLNYRGGGAEGRMIRDKLKSLEKALLYSYQAETAIFEDGSEHRCLLNPVNNKEDYKIKMISIPYESGIKTGDIFTWKETNTKWLVYLQDLEENAYFRADTRQCEASIMINDKEYWVYFQGPAETKIDWQTGKRTVVNDMNYSATMYITKDEDTVDYFHRFDIIRVKHNDGVEENWQVQTVDKFMGDGVIQLELKEWYENQYEKIEDEDPPEPDPKPEVYIDGEKHVDPFSIVTFSIVGSEHGEWFISDKKRVKILNQTDKTVEIQILTGRSCNIDLIYKKENEEDIILNVIIDSL